MSSKTFISTLLFLFLLLVGLTTVDVFLGSTNLFTLSSNSSLFQTLFYQIRLPKAITCIIAGSGLALCGLLMQTLFRNPLAGPYALGISSGSSFFVAVATMLLSSFQVSNFYFFGKSIVTLFAMLGALFVTLIILFVSKKNKSNVTVLLIGLMLAQVLGAMQGLVEYLSSSTNLKTFIMWGMGNVSSTTLDDLVIILPFYTLPILLVFFLIKPLNAILLNEDYAKNLGINVHGLRFSIIIITAVLVGVITAFCGPIAFVGISVPIASRLFFKTSQHQHQIPFTLLLGAIVLLFADIICQLFSNQLMMPLNTVTTMVGAPVVLYLLFKSKLAIA